MSGPALDKATLIAIATAHPLLAVRRSAAHTLFSFGCIQGAMSSAAAMQAERAQELAANAAVGVALEKAAAVKS